MKINSLKTISDAIACGDLSTASEAIDTLLLNETGKYWNRDLRRLQAFMADGMPRFTVLVAGGNVKLPFLSFSSLPGVGFCPGAGDCLEYCYSCRGHRYPATYARQAQNSILMQSTVGRELILLALDRFDTGDPLDFRLYVDGDFGSVADVTFWMDALADRPWLRAYGYSKSFVELLAYQGTWPDNYRLNISSGHRHGLAEVTDISRLPITRGDFIAVDVGYTVLARHHGTRKHNAALRKAYGRKAFTCPGRCGTCTNKGHACGSSRFNNIPIIIAVH